MHQLMNLPLKRLISTNPRQIYGSNWYSDVKEKVDDRIWWWFNQLRYHSDDVAKSQHSSPKYEDRYHPFRSNIFRADHIPKPHDKSCPLSPHHMNQHNVWFLMAEWLMNFPSHKNGTHASLRWCKPPSFEGFTIQENKPQALWRIHQIVCRNRDWKNESMPEEWNITSLVNGG